MAGIRADVDLNINTTQAKRSLDRAANEINKVVNKINGKQVAFNVNSKSFTQPLGRITASANEFTKSLEASNARVIAFGASVGIINGVSDAFKNLVLETIRFEKTLTDINVVLNVSNQSLQKFGSGLFDVAKNTAQSFNIAAEAALEFSRQGLATEEVLKRTNDALILTRLTGLKAADAVSGLTAAINAFAGAGLTTTDIIDKLAAVDVKFAVSSEDLINGLERAGAVAIDAGVNLDSLIGLVTALQQTTARGGAVIGNSLKTIFTRIQRPESIRQLEDLGIAVRSMNGEILSADKVLLNMAKRFDQLTQAQQSNVVQFSAGIFQANVFRAILRDLSKEQNLHAQATNISANASGEAAQKNEMLNKSLAALASQAGTGIRELAGIIGELAVKPEIGGFLEFLVDKIEGIKNMLGGGEEEGSAFAKGLVRGIGNVLTGPAAIAFGAVFIKLFMNISKFASTSLKDVLGVVSQKDKIRQMEESIVTALSSNRMLQESLNNLEGDRLAQEKFILGIIEAQTSAMREQQMLASRLAKPLLRKGVSPDLTMVSSGGLIPESTKQKERRGARKGGYSAGAIDSMNIDGIGNIVYNKAETVKKFPGMRQPAIMPPEKSKAGGLYKSTFSARHGFDPYASGGFIPNFAMMQGSKLILDNAMMEIMANPFSAKAPRKTRKAYVELAQQNKLIDIESKISQLISGQGGTHTKKIRDVLMFLQTKGVDSIQRPFRIRQLPYKRAKSPQDAEQQVLKAVGSGYFMTGSTQGSIGDDTFPVDLAGLGMSPLEIKSGEWKLPNVLMKSLRLYSDDGILNFAKRNFGATEEMISQARQEKFRKGSKLLIKKGILPENVTEQQAQKALLDYRLSHGFVPNYRISKNTKLHTERGRKYERHIGNLIGQAPGHNTPIDWMSRIFIKNKSNMPWGAGDSKIARKTFGVDMNVDAHKGSGHAAGINWRKLWNSGIVDQLDVDQYYDPNSPVYKKPINLSGLYTEIVGSGREGKAKQSPAGGVPFKFSRDVYRPKGNFYNEGLIPNFAVNLSGKYYDTRSVKQAINKLYKKSGGRMLPLQDLDFAAQRYISAINDSKSSYPGGKFSIGGRKFNFNEVSMALMKHGQFYQPKEGETIEDFFKGFVPNFANPLLEAIGREKAAGIPASKIRIEKSGQLRSSKNPMGLAVTNTRDEPHGVGQGIRRAKLMGLDPKRHGAAKGLIPNFAREEGSDRGGSDGLMRLFVFQSLLSTANGFLQEFAESGNETTKRMSEVGIGLSQFSQVLLTTKEVQNQLTDAIGLSSKEMVGIGGLFKKGGARGAATREITKGLKASINFKGIKNAAGVFSTVTKGLATVGKGLLRFTPIIGQIITFGSLINEGLKIFTGKGIFDYLKSDADKAADKLKGLAEAAEKTENAIGAANNLQATQEKITKLEILGKSRTAQQDKELLTLRAKEIKERGSLKKSIADIDVSYIKNQETLEKVNKVKSGEIDKTEELIEILTKLSIQQAVGEQLGAVVSDFQKAVKDIGRTTKDPKRNLRVLSKPFKREITRAAIDAATTAMSLKPENREAALEKTAKDLGLGRVASEFFTRQALASLEKQTTRQTGVIDEARTKEGTKAELEKVLFLIQENRKQEEFTLKLTNQRNEILRKERSFKEEILKKYGAINQSVAIEAEAIREAAKNQEKFNLQRVEANNKAVGATLDILKEFVGPKSPETIDKILENAPKGFEEIFGEIKKQGSANEKITKLYQFIENDLEKAKTFFDFLKNNESVEVSQKVQNKLEGIVSGLERTEQDIDIQAEAQRKSTEQQKIKNLIDAKTIDGAMHLQELLSSGVPFAESTLESMRGNAAVLKVLNDFRNEELQKILESKVLQEEATQIQIDKNRNDLIAAAKSAAQAKAQAENLSKTKEYSQIIQKKIEQELYQAQLSVTDSQLKNEFYSVESNRLNLVKAQLENEIVNLNTDNLIKLKKLELLNEYGKATDLARDQVQNQRVQAATDLQMSIAKAEQTGSPESMLDVAEKMSALNKEMGTGSRAMDMLREKLAEAQVNAANLGSDLISIGFDEAKSGLKQLFKDIGSGAKSASEAWESFGLSIADSLLDRIMEHNIDQMMSNLSVAFTGQDLLKDSNMLLKQSIDQLNSTMMTISPSGLNLNLGGRVQKFNEGGFVRGKQGIDKVPAMLTAGEYVLNRDEVKNISKIARLEKGGVAERIKKGAMGAAQGAVMVGVSKIIGKKLSEKQDNPPPRFNITKLKNLDLGSDVNLKRGDPRLSAQFLAEDPVMEDYRNYLLELATYRAQKTNEKFREKQNTLSSVMGAAMSFAVSQLASVAAGPIQKGIQKGKNFFGKTAGKHQDAYKSALKIPGGENLNYQQISNAISKSGSIEIGGKNWEYKSGEWLKKQGGGSIPAMLTAGEGFIPSSIAKRIGYNNLNVMNNTGSLPIVRGPGGIDNVGPVGLSEGDFILRKSSTDKLLRENPNMMRFALQNPEGFKRGERGYYEGGMVSGSSINNIPSTSTYQGATSPDPRNRISSLMESVDQNVSQTAQQQTQSSGDAVTNNINVNVTIDGSGNESVSTDQNGSSFEREKDLGMKIKAKVLEVIRDEKRIGGELS